MIRKTAMALVLLSTFALAQTFTHVIVVVQENRTPDNLFGSCPPAGSDVLPVGGIVGLATTKDIGHSHAKFLIDAAGNWPTAAINYVQNSDVVPYCQMAAAYGFADRMYQTNQGPSFAAHQFLVSGTSSLDDLSHILAMDNPTSNAGGCTAPVGTTVNTIDDNNVIGSTYPCFTRSSIFDLLGTAGITWRYYAAGSKTIWNAPLALTGYYTSPNIAKPGQFLTDVAAGNLAGVSYVTPTAGCSDHAGGNTGCGPSWVASIVNAIGQSAYWQNTVILVTWDDWGGWYDHVTPLANNTGWAPYYAYGFRVPLLVISTQTPSMVGHGTHDFGSILGFIEGNFSLPLVGPGTWADAHADRLQEFFVPGLNRTFSPFKKTYISPATLASDDDIDNE